MTRSRIYRNGGRNEKAFKSTKKRKEYEYTLKTPTKKAKLAPARHSPIGKIYLKLPKQFKQAYKKKLFENKVNREEKSPKIIKKERKKSKSDVVKDVLAAFDFIEGLNSRHFVFKCSQYQFVYVKKNETLRRYPSKQKMRQFPVAFADVYRCIEFLTFLTAKACNVNQDETIVYSIFSFLKKLLSGEEKTFAQGEFCFNFEFFFDLTLSQLKNISSDDCVGVTFSFILRTQSSRITKKNVYSRLKSQEKINLEFMLVFDPTCLKYLNKENRESLLSTMIIISVLVEHYCRDFAKIFLREVVKLQLKKGIAKNKVKRIFVTFNRTQNRREIKPYVISTKCAQLTPKAMFEQSSQTQLSPGNSSRGRTNKNKKFQTKFDQELENRIKTVEQGKITSSQYFDIFNCELPFVFHGLPTLRPRLIKCKQLDDIIKPDVETVVYFVPGKSTARLSLIQPTRMNQIGVRLGFCQLSPLLFRIEPSFLKITAQTLNKLDNLAQKLLFGSQMSAVKLQTTPDYGNECINRKRFVNSWKVYLEYVAQDDLKNSKNSNNEVSAIVKEIVDSLSFPFSDYLVKKKISSVLELKNWFARNGTFISLHFQLLLSKEATEFDLIPLTSEVTNFLRASDVKLTFLVKRTYGHDKTKLFVRKAFENMVSFGNVSEIQGASLFSIFLEKASVQWENNNFVRFDLFLSERIWNIVKNKPWLMKQLQTFVSVYEAHLKAIFRNWALADLLKQVLSQCYQSLYNYGDRDYLTKSLKGELTTALNKIKYLESLMFAKKEKGSCLEEVKKALGIAKTIYCNIESKIIQENVSSVLEDLQETISIAENVNEEKFFFKQWKATSVADKKQVGLLLDDMICCIEGSNKALLLPHIYDSFASREVGAAYTNFMKKTFSCYSVEESNTLFRDIKSKFTLDVKAPCVFTEKRNSFGYNTVAYDVTNKKLLTEKELRQVLCSTFESNICALDWCFDPDFGLPENYSPRKSDTVLLASGKKIYKVGVRTFLGVFSNEEFNAIEDRTDALYELSKHARGYIEQIQRLGIDDPVLHKKGKDRKYFNDNTAHHVFNKRRCIRTKMFFNYRYLWTKEEMKHKDSKIAHGIRSDPSRIPKWMIEEIEDVLTMAGIIKPRLEGETEVKQILAEIINKVESKSLTEVNGFKPIEMNTNSFAVNIYHDGSIGLSQHFDDAKRFRANIVSMRLYSDSRLSFDCKGFGCMNGKFTIDMPRGSLQVLDNDSYAGKEVTHCIRAGDMMGKSGVLLLREIQERAMREADTLLIRQATESFAQFTL